MLKRLGKTKAQSTAEYAILIGLIIAAAVGMQTYVKRGIQGRIKDTSDNYVTQLAADTNWAGVTNGTTAAATLEGQYEPLGLSSKNTQAISENVQESTMNADGTFTRSSARTSIGAAGDYQEHAYQKVTAP